MLEVYGRERGGRLRGRQKARRESERKRERSIRSSTRVVRSRFEMLEEIFETQAYLRNGGTGELSDRIKTRGKDRS